MKKFYLLFLVVILAACSTEPVENEVLSGLDANLEGKNNYKATIQEVEDPMGFYTGQNNGRQLKGTLEIWNDCENFYLEIIPTGDYPTEVEIWIFTELPALNGGGNNIPGESQYSLAESSNLIWSFPINNFNINEELLVFVKAWGGFTGSESEESVRYSEFLFDFSMCGCDESFDYIQNEDGTYTFTYVPAEDVDDAELVFTFPQSVNMEGLEEWTHNGKENSQTFNTTMNLVACTPYSWTVSLDAECNPSGKAILWSDFNVEDDTKKESFELENILKYCN